MKSRMVFSAFGAVCLLALASAASLASGPALAVDALDQFLLDTHEAPNDGAAGPAFSTVSLRTGFLHEVTVAGTFSVWSAATWEAGHCGNPEDAPMIASPGVANGMVGFDAEFIFAAPGGSSACQQDMPFRHPGVQLSVDGGSTWTGVTSVRGTPDTHSYAYLVVGQGSPVGVRFLDNPTEDNYGVLSVEVRELGRAVEIDIKPGSSPNSINPSSQGTTPVAILSTEGFNAPDTVDRESLTFGRTGGEESLFLCSGAEDVNDDGLLDLVCHFATAKTGLLGDEEGAVLRGLTEDGGPLAGSDSVRLVPPTQADGPSEVVDGDGRNLLNSLVDLLARWLPISFV